MFSIHNEEEGDIDVYYGKRYAFSLPLFQHAKLIAGKKGESKPIRWIVVLELLDEIDQLQEGEMLLTTAFDLQSCDKLKNNLIQKLAEKKLAGLILQTGYYLESTPEELKKASEIYQFPIIEIPKSVAFSSITKTVHQQIIHAQFEKMKYSEEIYTTLTELAKNNEGLPSFASSISSSIKADIFFYDNNFNKLCAAFCSSPSYEEELIQTMIMEHHHTFKENEGQLHEIPMTGMPHLFVQPIHSKDSIYGYLAVVKNELLNAFEEIAVQHTSTIAALEFIKLLKLEEKDNQLKGDFLELVLTGSNLDQLTIYTKGETLGYNITSENTCVTILKIDSSTSTTDFKRMKIEQDIQQIIFKLLQDHAIEPLFKRLDNQFIMLLTNYYPHRISTLEIMEKIAQHVQERYDTTLSIGIGNYYNHFTEYHRSYKEAQEALFIIEAVWKKNKRLHYKELGLYKLLLPLLQNEALMKDYYQNILGGVLANEKLIETLRVYLEDMRTNNAADKLFIHRHTLKYRMNKIESLTHRKLNHFQDRIELELALILHNIFEKGE
ncbi:PucR family transcriptional regulator ligand-binding domain-containing protein [Bacillus tianshenii]|nr:PucR family transcriptional regulator ligand-binding domain-containing protein [Bacillus tianshenii]